MISEDSCDNLLSNIQLYSSDIAVKKYELHQQPKEKYYGNREYKRHLILEGKNKIYAKQLQKRCTQLLFRIREGHGKAVYLIGVEDNGNTNGLSYSECIESIKNFIIITKHINAKINKMRIYTWQDENESRYCVIFKVAKVLEDIHCLI